MLPKLKQLGHALLLTLAVSLVSGCASLEDFQQMDTQTRTEFVCDRVERVNAIDERINEIEERRQEIQLALTNGYRIVELCEMVLKEVTKEECTTTQQNGQSVTTCVTVTEEEPEELCYEGAVGIDGDLEKAKLQALTNQQAELRKQRDYEYMSCFNTVGSMTPEQAFDYYQQN